MKYSYKIIVLLLTFILLINSVLPFLYQSIYKLINKVDVSIYMRYATDDKFEENIFFSRDNQYGILSDLSNYMKGISSQQEFAQIMIANKEDIRKIIENNTSYINYLNEQGSSVEEFFQWCEKIARLDENILKLSLFLVCIIFAVITVVIFKCRKTFYCVACLTYVIVMMSAFSEEISDYLVVNAMNFLGKFSNQVITYQDANNFKLLFAEAYKESMLAFIIFDTVIQILQSENERKKVKEINYFIYSVELLINFMDKYTNNDCKYLAKFKIPTIDVLNRCKRSKKRLERNLKQATLNSQQRIFLSNKLSNINCLINRIDQITKSNIPQKTAEYIEKLTEIRFFIYTLRIFDS